MGCFHVKLTSIESCINSSISLLNEPLKITTIPFKTLDISVSDANRLEIQASNETPSLEVSIRHLHENHLNVLCSLVCSLNVRGYIEVSPEEMQWITEDTDITYIVKSNTDWEIITE